METLYAVLVLLSCGSSSSSLVRESGWMGRVKAGQGVWWEYFSVLVIGINMCAKW